MASGSRAVRLYRCLTISNARQNARRDGCDEASWLRSESFRLQCEAVALAAGGQGAIRCNLYQRLCSGNLKGTRAWNAAVCRGRTPVAEKELLAIDKITLLNLPLGELLIHWDALTSHLVRGSTESTNTIYLPFCRGIIINNL